MPDPDFDRLVEYIATQLDQGIKQQTIRSVLTEHGVETAMIDQAMAVAFRDRTPPPDTAPKSILTTKVPTPAFFDRMTLFRYRIGRAGYLLGHVYLGVPTLISAGAELYLLAYLFHSPQSDEIFTNPWIQLLIPVQFGYLAVLIILEISLTIRRKRDIETFGDDPVEYYLLSSFVLLLRKGDEHENKYGPPPVFSRNPLVVLGLKKPPLGIRDSIDARPAAANQSDMDGKDQHSDNTTTPT